MSTFLGSWSKRSPSVADRKMPSNSRKKVLLAGLRSRYVTRRERVEHPLTSYHLPEPDARGGVQDQFSNDQTLFFFAVCQLIAGHHEFQGVAGKQQECSVELHVMALLKMLGSIDGQRHLADFLSVGGHTAATLLSKRVVCELLSFKADVIFWPEADERREISERPKTFLVYLIALV
ncbi:hypothetical protein GQ600_9471 [Phytophthora cactorum]|nr:hypothetical protein GQ600_9471 [Phytophthora cactorum]